MDSSAVMHSFVSMSLSLWAVLIFKVTLAVVSLFAALVGGITGAYKIVSYVLDRLVKRVATEISKDFPSRRELQIHLQASENLLAAVQAHEKRFDEGKSTMDLLARRQERLEGNCRRLHESPFPSLEESAHVA